MDYARCYCCVPCVGEVVSGHGLVMLEGRICCTWSGAGFVLVSVFLRFGCSDKEFLSSCGYCQGREIVGIERGQCLGVFDSIHLAMSVTEKLIGEYLKALPYAEGIPMRMTRSTGSRPRRVKLECNRCERYEIYSTDPIQTISTLKKILRSLSPANNLSLASHSSPFSILPRARSRASSSS